MTLFQRFKRFLFGVGLGIILVFFFFGNRSEAITGWMPNERVMKRLRETKLQLPDSVKCRLQCAKLDSTSVRNLFEDGNVRFRRSETKQEPKIYRVDFEQHNPPVQLTFSCDDSTSTIIGVEGVGVALSCNCD
jgi:hypothetical protein